jgi:phage virion morphogenesis protein
MEIAYDDAAVRGAAARLITFPGDRSRAMYEAIGGAMDTATRLRFRTGMDPDGKPWKTSQRVIEHGGQTLVLSRHLLDSETHNVLPENSGVEWGSNVRYAGVHQEGATIHIFARSQQSYRKVNKSGELSPKLVKKAKANFASWVTLPEYDIKIPARPYLGINAADLAEAEDIATVHLNAALLGTTPAAVRGSA